MSKFVKYRLEYEKRKLNHIILKYGIDCEKTLNQSKKVDNIITQYYKQIIK